MPRRFINQLADQESVDEIYIANNKQLRPNRNGDLYLQVDLSDRSGTLSARMWNADEATYNSFENGDFVRVRGTAQVFQGAMQMIAARVQRERNPQIDEADFFPLTPSQVERLTVRLSEVLRSLRDPALQALGEAFLIDSDFMRKLSRAPAGVKNHHAYHGGLLEHIVTMMDVARKLCDVYPMLHRDLLLMGVFLHDIGKLDELTYERAFSYSDAGQLLGHVTLGVSILLQKVQEAEKLTGESFPEKFSLQLQHMILSHHGEYQYGSPKLPMTLEAVALTYIDNLDAKLNSFQQLIREDATIDSSWTIYHPALGRKLFKSGA